MAPWINKNDLRKMGLQHIYLANFAIPLLWKGLLVTRIMMHLDYIDLQDVLTALHAFTNAVLNVPLFWMTSCSIETN